MRPERAAYWSGLHGDSNNLGRFFVGLFFANATFEDDANCQSKTIGPRKNKIFVIENPFQHTYYMLSVDGSFVFSLPDDYVENVTLTHHIPEDAAIEFPLSRQGTPTVKISGGCLPISEEQDDGSKKVDIEVGRSCSFESRSVAIVKDLQFKFKPESRKSRLSTE